MKAITDPLSHTTSIAWAHSGCRPTIITDALTYTTTMSYDGLNNLRVITDAQGYKTTYFYSGTLLTKTVDALGNTTIYTYSTSGGSIPSRLLIAQRDAGGRVTRYGYDQFGQRTVITAPGTLVTRYGYDPVGRLITTTAPGGIVAVNQYDAADHLIRVTRDYTTAGGQNYRNEYNLVTRYGYDSAGRQKIVTDTLGHVTLNFYDGAGRLISTTVNYTSTHPQQNYLNQYNLVTCYGYDNVVHQTLVTDTLGHVTKVDYDPLNRPVTVTTNYELGGPFDAQTNITRTTGYDPAGNVVTQTDTLGHKAVTRYDPLNRPVTVTRSGEGGAWSVESVTVYDKVGNVLRRRDAAGYWTYYEYDKLGRLITTTNALSGTTVTLYNAAGQQSKTKDAKEVWTWYEYNTAGRLVTVTVNYKDGVYSSLHPDEDIRTIMVYDTLGRRIKTIEAAGVLTHTTVYTYSPTGRLIAMADPSGAITRYSYDALGRTILVTDTLTHATRTQYDALGRVITVTANYVAGGPVNAQTNVSTTNSYNALGWRTAMRDGRGNQTTFEYDTLGRVITTTDATSRAMVTVYDRAGNRVETKLCGPEVACITQAYFDYDGVGRLIAQTDALSNATHYAYDSVSNRTVMTDANTIVTHYGYDKLSRLTTVNENYNEFESSNHQTNVTTRYGYDALGNRTIITNARGYTTTYTYDALSRLLTERDPLAHTTRYWYDALGNRVVMTDANSAVTRYAYDAANRPLIITYTADSKTVRYSYDKLGNRTAMTDATGTTRYSYDALYRPLTITSPYTGSVYYRYDAVGNRTRLVYPDNKVVTYTYDAANRLASTTSWGGQTTAYTYDAFGRLAKTSLPNGTWTSNAYDTAGRLVWTSQIRGAGALGRYAYNVDSVGNRTAVTETLGDLIFADGFESGNFGAWSAAINSGSDFAVTARSAMVDTYGMEAILQAPHYVRDDTPNSEPRYRARFYFDPNSVGGVSSRDFDILVGRGGDVDVFRVQWRLTSSSRQIGARIRNDSTTESSTSWYSITDAPHYIEIDWKAATAPGANNGYITLWIDGVLKQTISGIDNDTRRVDEARLGIVAATSGLPPSGTPVYFDAFESRRSVYIGPVVAPPSDLIFTDGFESGDFLGWSAVIGSDEDFAVTTWAAMVSSTYGMQAPASAPLYVRDDTPNSELRYRARFYFDPDGLCNADFRSPLYTDLDILVGRSGNVDVFRVQLRLLDSGGCQIGAWIRNDSTSESGTSLYGITDAPHYIEIDWKAATSPGSNNGYISLWIDGVLKQTVSSIDNDTRRVDEARLGMVAMSGSGMVLDAPAQFDAFESRRTTYIGPASDVSNLLTSVIQYTYDPLYRLTDASYSDGKRFQYQYDAVGNRTRYTQTLPTHIISETAVFTVAESADDAYVSVTNSSIDTTGSYIKMGETLLYQTYHAGLRFNPVHLPAGAHLVGAELRLMAYTNDTSSPTFYVYGEAASSPAAYTTYSNFMQRQLTTSSASWPVGRWSQGQEYGVDVTSVVREVMNSWTDGNAMALQVRASNTGTRQAWSVDGKDQPPARLRLTYTRTVTVTTYTYDAANRLTNVNGQAYTWSNNGNLTNDGSKTYTYNQANQLTGISATGLTWSAVYNGDGARRKQTVNGSVTTYTPDLAAPLVTVLAQQDAGGKKQYLYGIGDSPLASYAGTTWTYLSGRDGLGSVRQETDASGNVLATRSFDPYGVVVQGNGGSPFGYTGEQYDTYIKLMFLRARYYQPGLGVFLSRDPWGGDALRPGSLNGWNYVLANPVMLLDPSGLYPDSMVFFWPGAANKGVNYTDEWENTFIGLLKEKGIFVKVMYPYYFGEKSPGWWWDLMNIRYSLPLKNLSVMQEAANDSTLLPNVKAQETMNVILGCPHPEISTPQINFIGYSGGGQIAYSTAQKLDGTLFIDNLVLLGSPFRAYAGVRNIGHLWELVGTADDQRNWYLWGWGPDWERYNAGYRTQEATQVYYYPEVSLPIIYHGPVTVYDESQNIYKHGATRCSVRGASHYMQGGYLGYGPDRGTRYEGIDCPSIYTDDQDYGSTSRVQGLVDFLINVVGIGGK